MAVPSALSATVQDFGLMRIDTVWEPRDTTFIDSYIALAGLDRSLGSHRNSSPGWRSFKIALPRFPTASSRGPKTPQLLNGYAVSPKHNAYVTFCVQLTSPDGVRLTDMRYRDMIVDNYVSACASALDPKSNPSAPMSKLRWLGVANILNESSRLTFAHVFRLKGHDILNRGSVEIRPATDLNDADSRARYLWDLLLHDPFTRGVLALLHHRARDVGYAFVRRLIFISHGYEGREHSGGPSPLELRLDLVVELARREDDEIAITANI